jgi:NhaP-type Na+/H+ or K+/H+ antiporter
VYVVAGVGVLAAAALPRLTQRRAVSSAMGFLAVGLLVGVLPLPLPAVNPITERATTERLAEVTVLIALMGVGLAIDRPIGWRSWGATWRLLGIAMPLCIGAVALLGWGFAGLAPASALLLGAVLAPTDPVLAADVQVDAPNTGEEDEVRLALTSEAGLNDGLAFPFVYAAVAVAGAGSVGQWLPGWVAWELAGKLAIGVAVGVAVGYVVARVAFESPKPGFRYAQAGEAIVALAVTFLAYGLAEAAQGYGFLAVFCAAVTIRWYEREHDFHATLHGFVEQIERVLTLVLVLLLGVAATDGLLADLTWRGALVGVALLLVIRPLAAWVSLLGSPLDRRERWATAFFGVRGIGTVYYLAYAAGQEVFGELGELWATAGFTILLSVVLHGVLATPWMSRLDRARHAAEGGAPAEGGDDGRRAVEPTPDVA